MSEKASDKAKALRSHRGEITLERAQVMLYGPNQANAVKDLIIYLLGEVEELKAQ